MLDGKIRGRILINQSELLKLLGSSGKLGGREMKLLIPKQEEYQKKYYLEHKEEILTDVKKYNAKHEAKNKIYRKKYYEKNKERLLANMKIYRDEKVKELQKQTMIKLIQNMNKKYDEDYQMTYKKLAEMFGVSLSTVGKYIWHPRKRSRHIEPATYKNEVKRSIDI